MIERRTTEENVKLQKTTSDTVQSTKTEQELIKLYIAAIGLSDYLTL